MHRQWRWAFGCDSTLLPQALSTPSANSVTCATPSRPGARTVQFGAFRSVLTESLLFLPLPPVAYGRSRKAACPLQTASETSPVEPPLFPVPGRSSQDARGNLQTSPIHLLLYLL